MLKESLIHQIKGYFSQNRASIIESLNIASDPSVEFLAQGEYNVNFIIKAAGKKYVFRVNTGSQLQLDNQILYEYNSLKAIEGSGVTPKVHFVDDSLRYFDYGILIMEFLEGMPLDYEKDLKKAASIFSRIHSIKMQETNHFIVEEGIFGDRINEAERLLSNVWTSDKVNNKVKYFFDGFLSWARDNRSKENYFIKEPWHVVNNTEVNSNNFIIGKDKAYLIDWEKPVISDPAQDLTQFMAVTTTLWKTDYLLSAEEKEDFFDTYIEGLDTGDRNIRERVRLYTPYLYLRALSWCAHAYVEYHDPNKKIKNMDTFEKIKQFLDVDFMKDIFYRSR